MTADRSPLSPGDVLRGVPAAAGQATGRAVLLSAADVDRPPEPDVVLVVRMTDPTYLQHMFVAAAVVAEYGSLHSHTALVCRELGVPCVVGVVDVLDAIPDGARVTVDGTRGIVSLGPADR